MALLPGLSRSFDRMNLAVVVLEHSDKLKLQKRMSLVDSLESSDDEMCRIPLECLCWKLLCLVFEESWSL